MNLNILYRISSGSYKKNRLSNATKEHCFETLLDAIRWSSTTLTVLDDHTEPDVISVLKNHMVSVNESCRLEEISAGSSAASFNIALDRALTLSDNEYVLFAEDDYLWLKPAEIIIKEGLLRADYVAPYLHPDKFLPASQGGNPEVDDAGSTLARVLKTESSFWMTCNSTTMTFAARVVTLRNDEDVWRKHTTGSYPRDYDAFIELRSRGRTLIQPIPTVATHAEVAWLSPLIGTKVYDWKDV